jgi:hypothetical protein
VTLEEKLRDRGLFGEVGRFLPAGPRRPMTLEEASFLISVGALNGKTGGGPDGRTSSEGGNRAEFQGAGEESQAVGRAIPRSGD